MAKRIFVFSVDAMVTQDVEKLRDMPNFRKYFAGGSEFRQGMRTIYPTITYPIHTTMITGCYPERHRVDNNFNFTTDNKGEAWRWYAKAIKAEDLFTVAKRAGLTTAAFAWPVTGCHPDIDYLLDEYWMPEPNDTIRTAFARVGSSETMLEMAERYEYLLAPQHHGKKEFLQQPYVDNFWVTCCCETIRRFKPDVTFLHTGAFDTARHGHGVFGPHIDVALKDLDRYIGELGQALEDAGVLADTDLFLVSDHGQRNIVRSVNLNVKLADAGLIELNEDGTVKDWKAFCFSNAFSNLVFLKDPQDKALEKQAYELLKSLMDEGVFGIGRIFTAQEAQEQEHLAGDFSFVLESDGYTSFGDASKRPLVQNFDASDYRFGRATHGYLPDLGPQPIFLAKGPHIRENNLLDERGQVINEGPTFARVLGLELSGAQGQVMEEILR